MSRAQRSSRQKPRSAPPAGGGRFDALWGLVPALVAAWAYLPALSHPFVYDDVETVVDNPSLGEAGNWRFVLVYALFRPLVNVSYALDHAIFGPGPWGFHLTNLLLHALNAALVSAFVRRTLRARGWPDATRMATVAALVWCVHPLLTQAVGYVSQRGELLALTGMLASLLCFQAALGSSRSGRWLFGAALFGGLALLSKETAAALPLLLWAYDAWMSPPEKRGARWRRFHLPLLLGVGLLGVLRVWVLVTRESEPFSRSFGAHLVLQLEALPLYLRLWLAPYGQSLVHPMTEPLGLTALALLGALTLGLGVAAVLRLRRTQPELAFGLAGFLLVLLPSSLLPLLEPFAEHRLYAASAPLTLTWAWAQAKVPRSRSTPALLLALAVAAGLGLLTRRRLEVWSDARLLWADAAAKAPNVWAARFALGDAYREAGECEKALPEYRAAIQLVPAEPRAHLNLGICLGTLGDFAGARQSFREVLRTRPEEVKAYTNLAALSLMEGDRAAARAHVRRALALEPGNAHARKLARSLGELPEE